MISRKSRCPTVTILRVLDVDVVGAGPVRAVPLVAAHPGLAQPRARPDVPPVSVHCDKNEFNVLIPKEYIVTLCYAVN